MAVFNLQIPGSTANLSKTTAVGASMWAWSRSNDRQVSPLKASFLSSVTLPVTCQDAGRAVLSKLSLYPGDGTVAAGSFLIAPTSAPPWVESPASFSVFLPDSGRPFSTVSALFAPGNILPSVKFQPLSPPANSPRRPTGSKPPSDMPALTESVTPAAGPVLG